MTAFEAVAERREVRFALDARDRAGRGHPRARAARARVPGRVAGLRRLTTSEGPKTLALGPEYRVRPDPDFLAEAKALLGDGALV